MGVSLASIRRTRVATTVRCTQMRAERVSRKLSMACDSSWIWEKKLVGARVIALHLKALLMITLQCLQTLEVWAATNNARFTKTRVKLTRQFCWRQLQIDSPKPSQN